MPVLVVMVTLVAASIVYVDATKRPGIPGYYDVGFRTFLKSGWRRFYVEWYGAHIIRETPVPRTIRINYRGFSSGTGLQGGAIGSEQAGGMYFVTKPVLSPARHFSTQESIEQRHSAMSNLIPSHATPLSIAPR
jgi:hypothetical protein